jgi:hypothetical protein
MSATSDIIRGFIEDSAQLPPATLPAHELDQKKIDPSEYLKAKPVRDSLDSLVRFLTRFSSPEANPYLDTLPPALTKKIQSSLRDAWESVNKALLATRKATGSEQVGRSSESSFTSWAETISTVEGNLYGILAPIETEMKLGTRDSAEIMQLLTQRQKEIETLQSDLASLLKQANNTRAEVENAEQKASNTKIEVENAEQKASGTKQAIQATVLTKGFIDELKEAIFWHRIEGFLWLAAFCISSLVTLRFLVWIAVANNKLGWPFYDCGPVYNVLTAPVDIGSAIAMGVGKLLFASFAFGMCFLTARIYQTHAHNVIVNQQRRIAGISFPQLLEMIDTSDKESRQELVRQAAISVFAHGSSGFLHKGGNEFSALASVVSETFNKSRD